MAKIPYTKESARKLWTEARDKYQMQLDSKNRKGRFSHEAHMTALEDSWLRRQIRYCLQVAAKQIEFLIICQEKQMI